MTASSSLIDLFDDGTFLRGEPWDFDVAEEDFPTEYSATEYLAAATIGQTVAVGSLMLEREVVHASRGREREVYFISLVIVPERGVWVVEPVFGDFASAKENMNKGYALLVAHLGGEPEELHRAYIPVLGRVPTRPRDVPVHEYHDLSVYADVANRLQTRRSTASDTEAVARLVRRLLDIGRWREGKNATQLEELLFELPRWLVTIAPSLSERVDASDPSSTSG